VSSVFFASLAASVATVMAIQTVGPTPVLALYIIAWLVAFFSHRPTWLLMLWPAFLPLLEIFRNLTIRAGPILLLPLDPVYFLSLVCLTIVALNRPKTLMRSLRENHFLSFFLLIVITYIILCTPLYGKSAIGEARKFYVFFVFPVLTVFFVKTVRDLHGVLLTFSFGGVCLLVTCYVRLSMRTPLRFLADSSASLMLLFMVLTILIFHLNKEALINRTIDLTIAGLSVPIIVMTQHRTVFLASALGLWWLFWLYRARAVLLVKGATVALALLTVLGVIMTSTPSFERYTIGRLAGLINPSADRTGSWRIQGWQQQLTELSGSRLLFGEGLGTYYSWMQGGREVKASPHNAYIQLVLKFGLFGLMVYVLLALRFFRASLSTRRKLPPGRMRAYVEVGIVNYGAAHAYMLGYGFQPSMLIFLALAMAMQSLLRYHQEAPRPA